MSSDKRENEFLYLDTNIFGILVKKTHLIPYLKCFLSEKRLVIALSEIQAAELSDVITRMDSKLQQLLNELPARIIKTVETIDLEEINSYPNERKESLTHPSFRDQSKELYISLIKSRGIKEARLIQKNYADKVPNVFYDRRDNFVVDFNRSVTEQADTYAFANTLDKLVRNYPNAARRIITKDGPVQVDVLKSFQIRGYVVFYKYYVNEEEPDTHDHADLFHISYLPYCKFAIIEQKMCAIVNRIQKNNHKFNEVTVRDNRWLEKTLPRIYDSVG